MFFFTLGRRQFLKFSLNFSVAGLHNVNLISLCPPIQFSLTQSRNPRVHKIKMISRGHIFEICKSSVLLMNIKLFYLKKFKW